MKKIIVLIIIIFLFISVKIECKNEYKKLHIDISQSDIRNIEIDIESDMLGRYKVYKIDDNNRIKIENQLIKSKYWSTEKFYEYIMDNFYDIQDEEEVKLDRDNLYYYRKNGTYAIFDIKNMKLYYYENGLFSGDDLFNQVLNIHIKNYIYKEVYSVRCGPQSDGTDYYIWEFDDVEDAKILENIKNDSRWKKEKVYEKKLKYFNFNEEVNEIENGYYYYSKICRTSDKYKKYHFTDEEATGEEIAVYDVDNNRLYYYWSSI